MREQLQEIRNELLSDGTLEGDQPQEQEQAQEQAQEQEPEQEQQQAETPEAEEFIEYFNELPDALGISAEDFYNLKLKTSDGKAYTLSEVKDALQEQDHKQRAYEQQLADLREKESRLQQATLQNQQTGQAISIEMQKAQQEIAGLQSFYQTLNAKLTEAQQQDDVETMTKIQGEMLRVQGQYGAAQEKLQKIASEQQAKQQQAFEHYRTQQERLLQTSIPEWQDPDKRRGLQTELKTFLGDSGLSAQEIGSINDARLVLMAVKAMKWDKHQKEVKNVSQDIRSKSVRRLVKGARPSTPTAKKDAANQLASIAKKTHRESDQKKAFRAIAEEAGIL